MYNNSIIMDKYFNEGIQSLIDLNKTESRKVKINPDGNDIEKLSSIYRFLGYDKIFPQEKEGEKELDNSDILLIKTIVEYYRSQFIPITQFEKEVYDNIEEEYKDLSTDYELYLIDNSPVYINGTDLGPSIKGKKFLQIRTLMELAQKNVFYRNMFDDFRNGKLEGNDLATKVKKYLKENVKIILKDTDIVYKRIGTADIELYISPSTPQLKLMDPEVYVESCIYRELSEPTEDKLTYKLRLELINYMNTSNIYKINKENPYILFMLEMFCRETGTYSIRELLQSIVTLGNLIDMSPQVSTASYSGNMDGTISFFIKSSEAIIDKKYFNLLTKEEDIVFYSARDIISIKTKDRPKQTLWQYLVGDGNMPKDSPNIITDDNITGSR